MEPPGNNHQHCLLKLKLSETTFNLNQYTTAYVFPQQKMIREILLKGRSIKTRQSEKKKEIP